VNYVQCSRLYGLVNNQKSSNQVTTNNDITSSNDKGDTSMTNNNNVAGMPAINNEELSDTDNSVEAKIIHPTTGKTDEDDCSDNTAILLATLKENYAKYNTSPSKTSIKTSIKGTRNKKRQRYTTNTIRRISY
jgi:hypothetical protein